MTKTRLQIVALVAVLSALGVVSGAGRSATDTTDAPLKEIAGYKGWTRVTQKPMPIAIGAALG